MYMRKKILILIAMSFMITCLCSCNREISIDGKESFYSDFKIDNNKVYIYCNLLIKNTDKTNAKIAISGVFDNDVKNGLLKQSLLSGYTSDLETTEFNLEKGNNWIEVVFVGDYAGRNQKYDRLLPEIRIDKLQ